MDLTQLLLDCCLRSVRHGAQFADARALDAEGISLTIQDGRAEKLNSHSSRGVGVRVLVDGAWGFASADTLEEAAIERARAAAMTAAQAAAPSCRDKAPVAPSEPIVAEAVITPKRPLDDWTLEQKIARLIELERAGWAVMNGYALNSILSFGQGRRTIWLANSRGSRIMQSRPSCRLTSIVTAAVDEVRQQASEHKARLGGLELLADMTPEELTIKAATRVLRQCRAPTAPPGVLPVVFHPSITGLFAHEALGHNAEADSYYAGQSILLGKLGRQIGARGVTIVDDSTAPGAYGSFAFDDEGTPSARRTIIEDGTFTTLLHNLETAARFNVAPNGCGRAEDHSAQPIVRMSNTFVVPNPAGPTADEMIRSIDRGLYLAEGQEGYVFPERGQFVCRADSARRIEHGRLGEWLRDVSVSGLVLETLMRIEMVGRDFEMAAPGVCGKLGQGVPTDCGGPHLKISEMVVGGAE
ncbi:MAG: TldD/PmbA family protein [Phycisphaerae bacterium]|nr:TldD/PmbA family protein [Phycisphaerae bacterium]